MKKLNLPAHQDEAANIELPHPSQYEGVPAEEYYGVNKQEDESQLLRGIFSTIRKHWFLILLVNLLIVAAAIVYVAQQSDLYTAEARVQVNGETNPAAGVGGKDGGSSVIVSQGNDPGYFTTQLQILEGAGLLRRVVKTLDLENNQAFLNPNGRNNYTVWQNVERMFLPRKASSPNDNQPQAVKTSAKNNLSLKDDKEHDPDKEAEKLAPYVSILKRNLTIAPVKDNRMNNKETRLIEVRYTHPDPQIAAKIANAISDTYVLQNLERKVQTNASAGDFLQKRVAELQSGIRQGEERLLNYSRSNQILSLDSNQNTVVQRLADLNLKLGQAENDRIAAQTAYQAAVQNQMRTATAETKDPQVLSLEAKLNELNQKLAQLKTEYTEEWWEVIQTRKQIESVEKQIAPLRKRATDIQLATLQEKLDETTARERELRENFSQQRGDVLKQNEAAINYKIIQQEIDTNKSLLDGLLQRSRENDVILNGTPNNVAVIDRALVPRSPVGPERFKVVGMAFIASLTLGFGLGFVIDRLNDKITQSDNIENQLGLPLLAMIPAAPLSLGRRLLPAFSRKSKKLKKYNLKTFKKPEFLESYLQLRTYLLLSTAGGAPQTVLITSGKEGEGKTVTALNLARSLAKEGENILLIDADLRCPKIHNLIGVSNNAGLTTLLTAKTIDDELLEKAITKDTDSNLFILTSGGHSPNPADLLSSDEMRALLTRLSGKYAHIIIDSPPVLYFSDSLILSALADAVVMVVRENVSSKQIVLEARKMLQSVGARIVGMVLNGIPLKHSNYYKYRDYGRDENIPAGNGTGVLKLN